MENQTNKSVCNANWMYAVALLVAVALVAGGVALSMQGKGFTMLAAGAIGVVGVLVTWPIAIAFSSRGIFKQQFTEAMNPVYERLEQYSVMLNEMSEQQLLSDRAKQVAYREKDREALRRAIQDDIAKKDWEAALVLVEEMDNVFGYKQEAESIREDINQRFSDHIRRQIQMGTKVIDRHTSKQQWAAAVREAQRLQQQFPLDENVRNLGVEIEQRRTAYKNKLMDEYVERVNTHDIDGAISVVKKLDFYLTPNEAQGIQDSVRQLFKDKLQKLRDQFVDASHKNQWPEAYRIASIIVTDYPNTQMATELRDKLDALKSRAGESAEGVAAGI